MGKKLAGDPPKLMTCSSCHGVLRLTYFGGSGIFAWVHVNRNRASACAAMKAHRAKETK